MSEQLKAGSVVSVNGVDFRLCAAVEVDPLVPPVVYPRLLWSPDGVEITVKDADEQAAKEAEGYRLTQELPAEVPEPEPEPKPEDEGPTFGPPHDDTYAQVEDSKPKKATATKKK